MMVITSVKAEGRLADIEDLYRSRYTHFLRVAIAVTGRSEVAVEAVQDAFGDAIRSRASYRGDGSLEAWVWRLVVNASRDARAQPKQPLVYPFEQATSANGGRAECAELRNAIAALPERQRLVVFLRYYADLDYRSIGDALGIATGTVSATLNQAHHALRRVLEEVEA
jgi:RNA polymerase sigma-70 factor (ECF subfamily)